MNDQLTDFSAWRLTSPLAIVFFLGKLLTNLFKQTLNLVTTLGASTFILFQLGLPWQLVLALVVGGLLALLGLIATLSFLCFRFRIGDQQIEVKSGVFVKKHLDVKWDRVRALNIERGPIDRLFGIGTISIDTAGTASSEVSIPAIRLDVARALQARVDNLENQTDEFDEEEPVTEDDTKVIFSLSAAELLKASLCARGAILIFLGVLGTIVYIWSQLINNMSTSFDDFDLASSVDAAALEQQFESDSSLSRNILYPDRMVESIGIWLQENTGLPVVDSLWAGLLFVFVILLLFFFLLVLSYSVLFYLNYYKLTLSRKETTLYSSRGLLTKRQVSIEEQRVQMITCVMNLRERMVNQSTVEFAQSSSEEMHRLKIPGVTLSDTQKLVDLIHHDYSGTLPVHPKSNEFTNISIVYCCQLLVLYFVVPSLIIASVLIPLNLPLWLSLILGSLPLFGAALAIIQWKKAGYAVGDNFVVRRSGRIGYRIKYGKLEKVQSIDIGQNVIQRFTGKSTLKLHFATELLVIPYLELNHAVNLRAELIDMLETRAVGWL